MTPHSPPVARIFIAEDNPADVFLVEQALREQGVDFDLEVAEDGKQALSLLRGQSDYPYVSLPGLILLDLNLPQRDGAEILGWVRQNQLLSSVPVVVFSSSCSPKDRMLAMQSGATHFFRKPGTLEELTALGAALKDLLQGTPRSES